MAKGDPDLIDANDRVNELVKRDPEAAQEIIDRMYEEGRLPDEVYEDACEMVNRHK